MLSKEVLVFGICFLCTLLNERVYRLRTVFLRASLHLSSRWQNRFEKAKTRDVICLFMYPPIVLTNRKSTVCLHTTVRLGLLFAVLVLFSYIPNKIRRGPRTTNSLLSSILHTFYVILQFGGIPKLTANFRLWVAERYSADVRSELNLLIRFRL